MFAQRLGERHAPLHVRCGIGQDFLIHRVAHDQSGNFEPAQYLDAAAKHRREIVRDAGKVDLAVNASYRGRFEPRAGEHFSTVRSAREPVEKDTPRHKEGQHEEYVARHEFRKSDDHSGVEREGLPDLLEHAGELRDDERHHEDHDDDERHHNERGIDQGIAGFLGQLEISVQIVGEEGERLIKLTRLLTRPDHVDVKRREDVRMAGKGRRDSAAALEVVADSGEFFSQSGRPGLRRKQTERTECRHLRFEERRNLAGEHDDIRVGHPVEERKPRREHRRFFGRVDTRYHKASPLQGGDGDVHVDRINGSLPLIAFGIKGSVGENSHTSACSPQGTAICRRAVRGQIGSL